MVAINHPLLDELRRFDAEAGHRYSVEYGRGLGSMGLLLYRACERDGYWCTPKNSMGFAGTGGNGVHFSFVVESDCVTESSPVIVTVPGHFGDPADANIVVADSLRNFLRFGLHRGYFALEQLAYHRDLTLEVYSSPDWQPTEHWHDWVGYVLTRENWQHVRDFLIERFQLTPLGYTIPEFEALQAEYKPRLVYPTEDEW